MSLELELVEWLRANSPTTSRVHTGIGDDMALLAAGESAGESAPLLFSSDMLLDGVHFDSQCQPMALVGRKAIACSLSDCAAMAVRPLAATVSLAVPSSTTLAEIQELYRGMWNVSGEFDLAIVGGDTTAWPCDDLAAPPNGTNAARSTARLAIDVAIIASPYPGIAPVRRSGARPGDVVFVTGPLGGSILGRHLSFTPRIHEARRLREILGDDLHAMMDVSDGLSLDLWRICAASSVGAVLNERDLLTAVHPDAETLARRDQRSALEHALGDGEDFELLACADVETFYRMKPALAQAGLSPIVVGEITPDGYTLRGIDGKLSTITPRGFVHG